MTTIYTGENVVIKGQITFGNDCSIWHNSVIRTENDPITIGNQTNIQDLVMIHGSLTPLCKDIFHISA